MPDNNRNKPVLIIGLAILFFILLSLIPGGIKIGPFELKPVDLFIDIKPDSLLTALPTELQNSVEEKNESINSFKLTAAGFFNLDLLKDKSSAEAETNLDAAPPAFEKLSGNVSHMNSFFRALKNAGNSQVRIAHYGDSEIEGDLITADFRQYLQEKFGGTGAGFLSITSQDIAFRTSTKHTFSNNWNTASVFSGSIRDVEIGIDGSVSIPQGRAWVKYETTGRFKNLRSFNTARVFYNNAKPNAKIYYSFDGGREIPVELKTGSAVNEIVLKADGEVKSFRFSAEDKSANFYGVSLESGNGVYVDNFPLRGNTGVSIRDFSGRILKDFNKLMDYDLIILSFGLNVASSNLSDYTWYEKEMIKAVNLLKTSFPQASILIVSVGDKGIKKGSSFVTDPNIPKLVAAQRNIAVKSGVAFWNLFEAMGGENSIAKWVNAKPPLAFKDYTHVNLPGANKIADMMADAILDAYKNFK